MAERTLGIGMIGCGVVGGGVAELLRDQAELYARRCGVQLQLRRVLVRDTAKAAKAGVVDPEIVTDDAEAFFATSDIGVVIEVAGGVEPVGSLVRRALSSGKHVVTANKSLLAAQGPELFAMARQHDRTLAFEASCGGGIPIINAIQFGLMANQINGVYGILNGTCNYILTEMVQQGKDYAVALKEAQDAGFAEADPTLDVSGRDAAQKLAIVASLAFGVSVRGDQVWSEGIDTLDIADIRFAGELGYSIKLLAIGERLGDKLSLRVHPCFVHKESMIAQVNGSFNALSVYGHANGHTMYYGRGAGRLPTASAIVGDLLNVASGWYETAFSAMSLWPDQASSAVISDPADLSGRFYLRFNALDVPGVVGKVSTVLGDNGISISSILQHEVDVGKFVPLVIATHEARQGAIDQAIAKIQSMDVIDGKPVAIRIVEMPKG